MCSSCDTACVSLQSGFPPGPDWLRGARKAAERRQGACAGTPPRPRRQPDAFASAKAAPVSFLLRPLAPARPSGPRSPRPAGCRPPLAGPGGATAPPRPWRPVTANGQRLTAGRAAGGAGAVGEARPPRQPPLEAAGGQGGGGTAPAAARLARRAGAGRRGGARGNGWRAGARPAPRLGGGAALASLGRSSPQPPPPAARARKEVRAVASLRQPGGRRLAPGRLHGPACRGAGRGGGEGGEGGEGALGCVEGVGAYLPPSLLRVSFSASRGVRAGFRPLRCGRRGRAPGRAVAVRPRSGVVHQRRQRRSEEKPPLSCPPVSLPTAAGRKGLQRRLPPAAEGLALKKRSVLVTPGFPQRLKRPNITAQLL